MYVLVLHVRSWAEVQAKNLLSCFRFSKFQMTGEDWSNLNFGMLARVKPAYKLYILDFIFQFNNNN